MQAIIKFHVGPNNDWFDEPEAAILHSKKTGCPVETMLQLNHIMLNDAHSRVWISDDPAVQMLLDGAEYTAIKG